MRKKKVVILIPTHRPNLTRGDKISLAHLKKYLSQYDTFFLIPKRISSKVFIANGYKVKRVEDKYFGTVSRYSTLLLTKKFYEMFKTYDFMLIYQLDVLVFSRNLNKWAESGYDYVAPPWFKSIIGYLSHKKGYPASGGNGGFSLRNIKKSIKVLGLVNRKVTRSSESPFIRKLWFLLAVLSGKSHKVWLHAPADNYPFNEDGFWSLEAPKYDPSYKVAPFGDALKFGFERFPKKCFELNKNRLPFGAHAWEKYDKEFWLQNAPILDKQA